MRSVVLFTSCSSARLGKGAVEAIGQCRMAAVNCYKCGAWYLYADSRRRMAAYFEDDVSNVERRTGDVLAVK